jgi:hypothetical protein
MSTKRVMLAVLVASAIALALSAGPQTAGTVQALPPTGTTLPYPGRLSNDAGQAVPDGAYDFTFALYDAPEGGNLLWSETQTGVAVQGGSFNTRLGSVTPLPAAVQSGVHWLAVGVRGPGEAEFTALTPRQQVSAGSPSTLAGVAAAAPCPHDHLYETWVGSDQYKTFTIENLGAGDGMQGWAHSDASGLHGRNTGNGPGVSGYNLGNGPGVQGKAFGTGDGVAGESSGNTKSGVYGHNTYGAYGGFGVYGTSDYGRGVEGEDGGPDPDDSFGVYSLGDMKTSDDLTVQDQLTVGGLATFNGGKSGYVVEIAQNDDTVALEVGDVVVISGAGPAVVGDIPVIKVRRAVTEEPSAVVGIVDKHYVPAPKAEISADADKKAESIIEDGAIAPGEYLTVVTLGAYKAIKVDASYGAIVPGDLLVASPNPGYAMRAASPNPGTIIGKALGALPSGTGVIPVIVTLQ